MKKLRKRAIRIAKRKRLNKLDEFDLAEIIDIPFGMYMLKRKENKNDRRTQTMGIR